MIHKYYDNNSFCSLYIDFYDLYMKKDLDDIHNPKVKDNDIEIKAEQRVITPSLKDRFFKKSFPIPENYYYKPKISHSIEDMEFNSKCVLLKERKDKLIKESFTIEGITFKVLWDFIEFIEFAKKIIFYEDNKSPFKSTICEKDNKEHRYITIAYSENTSLLFDLFMVANPNAKENIECIKITRVVGDYKDSITVTDAQIEFDDESNVYLINTINYILCDQCIEKMDILFSLLFSFFVERKSQE